LVQDSFSEMEREKVKVSFVEAPSTKLRAYFDIEVS
jgi:hypothetical protein